MGQDGCRKPSRLPGRGIGLRWRHALSSCTWISADTWAKLLHITSWSCLSLSLTIPSVSASERKSRCLRPHSDLTTLSGPALAPLMLLRAIAATEFPTDDSATLESETYSFPPCTHHTNSNLAFEQGLNLFFWFMTKSQCSETLEIGKNTSPYPTVLTQKPVSV